MKTSPLKRVTIVGASSLEEVLIKDLQRFGVKGYTYDRVHGVGAKGIRPNEWVGPNTRFEIVVAPEEADKLMEFLADTYYESYALLAWMDDVQVLRPDLFS